MLINRKNYEDHEGKSHDGDVLDLGLGWVREEGIRGEARPPRTWTLMNHFYDDAVASTTAAISFANDDIPSGVVRLPSSGDRACDRHVFFTFLSSVPAPFSPGGMAAGSGLRCETRA